MKSKRVKKKITIVKLDDTTLCNNKLMITENFSVDLLRLQANILFIAANRREKSNKINCTYREKRYENHTHYSEYYYRYLL